MTVVYASDDNYAGLTAVSAVSVLKWNPGAHIVLLGCRLREESVELVSSRITTRGGSFSYHDVSERLDAIAARGFNGYTSYAAYSRLFIADLLSDEAGRILYLDCDTLVLGPLGGLFAFPMNGKPFAFGYDCIHSAYKRYVKVGSEDPYFNSGVMLADLSKWRESGATEALKSEFAHPHGPNPLGDQDMIVRAWKDYITPLPPEWNFLSQYFLFDYKCVRKINGYSAPWASETEWDTAQRSPKICHFSGHTLGRPWFTSSKHPMRSRYIDAAREADLDSVARQTRPMSLPYAVQYRLWKLLPRVLFHPLARLMLRLHILLTYKV